MKNKISILTIILALLCSCSLAPSDSLKGIQRSFSKQIAYMEKVAYEYHESLNNHNRKDFFKEDPNLFKNEDAILETSFMVLDSSYNMVNLSLPKYDGYYFTGMSSPKCNEMSYSWGNIPKKQYPRLGKGIAKNSKGEKTEILLYQNVVKENKTGFLIRYSIVFDKNKL